METDPTISIENEVNGMDAQPASELNGTPAFKVSRFFAASFVVCAIALAVANILLIRQNKDLKGTIRSLSKASEVQQGVIVPPLKGTDGNGNRISIEYDRENKRTLHLVFAPSCGVC